MPTLWLTHSMSREHKLEETLWCSCCYQTCYLRENQHQNDKLSNSSSAGRKKSRLNPQVDAQTLSIFERRALQLFLPFHTFLLASVKRNRASHDVYDEPDIEPLQAKYTSVLFPSLSSPPKARVESHSSFAPLRARGRARSHHTGRWTENP